MRHLNRFAVLAVLLGLAVPAFAGGPLLLRATGQPYRWPNGGKNIAFNPDQGGLGTLTHDEAVAQTVAAFGAWEALPTASATYVNAGTLDVDVNVDNFFPFLFPTAPDGKSAIIYDEDGAIFELLFGAGSGVLGFSSPEWIDVTTGDILEGVAFMNGGEILDGFPASEFLSVEVHEFGHYNNLAHTVVNGQIAFGDSTGPFPDNTTFPPPPSLSGMIETMYPFLFVGGGQETPHADDIAIFSSLYPEPSFGTSTGTITGRILAPNGRTPLTGVNVIARNLANPFEDAVSAISSDFTDDFSAGAPLVGTYALRGLTPNADYAVYVDGILFGGFSTPPRMLPGVEEFWNGSGESNDPATDAPGAYTPIRTGAGTIRRGVNIVFNRLPQGPIAIGDDDSVELWPVTPLRMCGVGYDSVWVNSNGNLTFGSPDFGFAESRAGFMGGPARIAGLWDDLDPSSGGVVSFSEDASGLHVSFAGVPQFFVGDENTFSIDVGGGTNRFRISYGTLAARDGLAGYSCGGRVTSRYEVESNLSALSGAVIDGRGKTAVFEDFPQGDNDLSGLTLDFQGPNGFRDRFEPNNTLATATPVNLPFFTKDRFAAISSQGGDVDYYRFTAKAGEWLVAETVPGNQVDTVLGLYDAGGSLLTTDDDTGAGLLSRIILQVPADGEYALAVSTYPDFGFTGAGGDAGRYVLSLISYRGTSITNRLGDDTAFELPIDNFTFPFQGVAWSSLFVQANGNFTFGDEGDPELIGAVPDLLDGPPRIAPFWVDLDPSGFGDGSSDPFPPGLVLVDQQAESLTVHFASVPGFGGRPPNYFSTVFNADGTFQMGWGAIDRDRQDIFVGVSQGEEAEDPGPTDLSISHAQPAAGTTYEDFSPFGDAFDLFFLDRVFVNPLLPSR